MNSNIYYRGTTIVKMKNTLDFRYLLTLPEYFQDDSIFGSIGFAHAIEMGKIPTTEITSEWHHYFVKNENEFECKKIYFK